VDLQEIENELSRLQSRREQLHIERADHAERLSRVENERQQCVLSAKIDGDANAQKRILDLEQIIDSERRAIADDTEAVTEIGRRLDALREQRRTAKIEEKRSEIQKIINARLDLGPERQLMSLKEELAKTARAILAANRSLISELEAFQALTSPESKGRGTHGLEIRSAACHVLLALKDIGELDLCSIESGLLKDALNAVNSVRSSAEV
jgi:hypothetical protein